MIDSILYIICWVAFIAIYALLAVYAERKISAYIQNRVGPIEVGPNGLFQTLADIIKLLFKEPIRPLDSDRILYMAAPVLIFASIFAGFAVVPILPGNFHSGAETGILFLMAIVSLDVIGVFMAGWGSNNKYSLLGSLRSVSQMLSYEIPVALSILSVIVLYGTLDLGEITRMQGYESETPIYLFGIWEISNRSGLLGWSIFKYPHLMIVWVMFFISTLAECNRAPFDLPEAESELVSGYHTEYGGFKFAVLFLAEYANMILVGLLGAVLFFGGYNSPFPDINLGGMSLPLNYWTNGGSNGFGIAFFSVFWILIKALIVVFLHIWIRWTLPRFRVDQLIKLSWKVLTPLGFILLFISAAWKLFEVYGHLQG